MIFLSKFCFDFIGLPELLYLQLIESGEKERLKELLRERLVECGWKDEMKGLCRFHFELN